MLLFALFYLYISQFEYILGAGYATGHTKCSKIKLYPEVFLEITIENISYYEVYSKMYKNDSGYNDLFYPIQYGLNYAYNKTYEPDYFKDIGAFLAKCKLYLYKLDNASSYGEGIKIYYDTEAYDNDYKYKMEKLFAKKYFKTKLYEKFEKNFKEWKISNYDKIYISKIEVFDTSISLNERLKGFGIMIAFICGIFTVSGTVIFLYNRTETHQKHLKQIADEFGFEDISEVSQITHFKLF
mmetsp:Transcript_71595/g.64272  ORF Transcript_71595/g.64272 Transcript_71595/m.64272 type:complete len:240 (+) Transcript_71595:68-787(+)